MPDSPAILLMPDGSAVPAVGTVLVVVVAPEACAVQFNLHSWDNKKGWGMTIYMEKGR